MVSEGVVIQFKDAMEKASESSSDAIEATKFVLKYALNMLSATFGLKISENTVKYAEERALKYVENKNFIDKHAVRASLLEFLEVVLGDIFNQCTPSEWLSIARKYGLYCLATAKNTIYAYDPNEDKVIIIKNVYEK